MVKYRVPREDLPYDPASKESIVEYSQLLVGKSLREACNVEEYAAKKGGKGHLGQAVEYCYFLYEPNSDQEPDFPEVGLELKTNPIKKNRNETISAKERLVLTMIDYCKLMDETWETSKCLEKMRSLLLVSYLHEAGVGQFDYVFKFAGTQDIPEKDMAIIRNDWETIFKKVESGLAHELSSADTNYLEACTKAATSDDRRKQPFSNELAKPRAFALKASYMTAFYRKNLDAQGIMRLDGEERLTLEQLVEKRFDRYVGMTDADIASSFGIPYGFARKGFYSILAKAILGVDGDKEVEEFDKANIKLKTIRVEESGSIKESMSFPAFEFDELMGEESWEDSDLFGVLGETRYLFVVFEKQEGVYRLKGCSFWRMSSDDLEKAKDVWDKTRFVVANGVELTPQRNAAGEARFCADGYPVLGNNLPNSSFNGVVHVRPHATKRAYRLADGTEFGNISRDASELPDGRAMTKQCFWLNSAYVVDQLELLELID